MLPLQRIAKNPVQAQPPKQLWTAWPPLLHGWLATGITVACVALLAANARLPSLGEVVLRARHDLLALAFAVCLLTLVCKAARWRTLYPSDERPGLGLAVTAIAVGQVANWAVPIRLGEAARVGLASSGSDTAERGAVSRISVGIGVLVAEKVLDGLMLMTTVLLLAIVGGLPDWVSRLGIILVAVISVGGFALALYHRNWQKHLRAPPTAPRLLRPGHRGRLAALLRQLEHLLSGMSAWVRPQLAAQAMLWSIAAWTLGGVINYLVLRSLDLNASIGAALAVLAALTGAAVLPSLPGRIGLFQYVSVVALLPFGLSFDEALAFSLALYAIVYLPPIAIGLLAAFIGPGMLQVVGQRKATQPDEAW